MREALLSFEDLMSHPDFNNSTIFLMLNKLDLFKQKIAIAPIAQEWPDFTGGSNCYAALCYFTRKFLELNRRPDRSIHVLCTDATNTRTFSDSISRIDGVMVEKSPSKPDSYKEDILLAAASITDMSQVMLAK